MTTTLSTNEERDRYRLVSEITRFHQRSNRRSRSNPRSYTADHFPRTPSNFSAAFFLASFFTAMNSSPFLLRLVQAVAPPGFEIEIASAPRPCVIPNWLVNRNRPKLYGPP